MRLTLVPSLLACVALLPGAEGWQATYLTADGVAVGTAVVELDGTTPASGARGLYQGFVRAPGTRLDLTVEAGFPVEVQVRRVDLSRPGGWRDEAVTLPARLATTPGEPLELRVRVAGPATPRVVLTGDAAGPIAVRNDGFWSAGGLTADWTLNTGATLLAVAPDRWRVTGQAQVGAWNRVRAEMTVEGSGHLALGPVRLEVDARGAVTVQHPAAGWTAGASAPRGPHLRLRRDGASLRAWASADGLAWTFVGRLDDTQLGQRLDLHVGGPGLLTAGNDTAVGGNLGGVATWNGMRPFNNVVLGGTGPAWAMDDQGKVIKAPADDHTATAGRKKVKVGDLVEQHAPLDAAGWPTCDFLFKGPYNQPAEGFSGVRHVLTFTGQARIQVVVPGSAKEARVTPAGAATGDAEFVDGYRARDNTSRWYLEVVGSAKLGLSPGFFATRRTPDAPLGSGVTNIDLRRVCDVGNPDLFRPEFLGLTHPFVSFRMMDWGETNHSTLSRWEDRVLPGADGHGEGIQAYEHMIALANATGSDLWLNIPALADEDFITRLLTLVRDGSTVRGTTWAGLRPDLNCTIEYSNECWNGSFLVSKQLTERITALRAAGTTYGPHARPLGHGLKSDISDNDQAMRYQYIAAHAATVIVPAIAQVFGPEAVGTRIRPYLGGWKIAPEKTVVPALQFLEQAGWDPRRIYAAAGPTGYFGGKALAEASGKGTNQADVPLEDGKDFFLALDESDDFARWSAVTTAWGLDLVAYEAGPAIGETPAMAALQVDPAFRTAVVRGINSWYGAGGGVSHWFAVNVMRYGNSFGDWNLTDKAGDLFHPRFQGVSDLLGARTTPPLAVGQFARPGLQFSLGEHLGKERGLPGWGETINLPVDRTVERTYLLMSETEGTLDLRLSGAGGQAVSARLLRQEPQSLRLPATYGLSEPVTLRLRQGLNALTLGFQADPGGERAAVLGDLHLLAPGQAGTARPLVAMARSKTTIPQLTVGKAETLRLRHAPGLTITAIRGDLEADAVVLKPDPKNPDRSTITITARRPGQATLQVAIGDRHIALPLTLQAVTAPAAVSAPHAFGHAPRVVAQAGFQGKPESVVDGTATGVETSEPVARLALADLPAGGLDSLVLSWASFTNPPFVPLPAVDLSRFGTIDIAWSPTAPADPLNPAQYAHRLPAMPIGRGSPVAPGARLASEPVFTSDLTGLAIPAGASVLLTFTNLTPAKGRALGLDEVRAAGPAPTEAPSGVTAQTTWMHAEPSSFANPAGPSVTLTWDPVPGAWAMPVVQASQDGQWDGPTTGKKATVRVWTLAPGSTTFVHDRQDPTREFAADNTVLEPGATWHYRVGWSQPGAAPRWSAPVPVTLATTSGIAAPLGLTATVVDADHLRLSWQAVPEATSYKIERRRDAADPWMLWGRATTTEATDASVDQGIAYTYRVRASTPAGDGDWSMVQVPVLPSAIAAPVGLVRRDVAGAVELTWDFGPGRGTAFEVLRGTTAEDLRPVATTLWPRYTDHPPQGTWIYGVRTLGHDPQGVPLVSPLAR